MKPFEWEMIYKSEDSITETWRAKTIGGWLVKNFNCIYTDSIDSISVGGLGRNTRRYQMCESMVFVEDAAHRWVVEKVE